ncbi:MAG: RNase P subunit p30 family protein [Nanoarchaeota archaeon]|nr:RNase P subunit p30 family protein [Nanoarchaeota archaeon]
MIDIVFPKENEKEFIKVAIKLDYSNLCFIYNLKDFKKIKKIENKNIKIHYGIISKPNKIQEARKLTDLVIVKNSEKNRSTFEQGKPDMIFSLEDGTHPDFIYFRNSGLNQVYCKLAKKNYTIIALNFNLLLSSRNKIKIIGRMMQNIKLCKKYKVPIAIASLTDNPMNMRNPKDLTSLSTVLGMDTQQSKTCTNLILNKIKNNIDFKKSGIKGIKIID